jgi:hypothetical protein
MKVCTSCGVEAPLTAFYSSSNCCKECTKTNRRTHYAKNRGAVRARVARYRASGRPKELRLANLDERRAKDRAYAKASRAKRTKYMRERRRADPIFRAASYMRARLSEIVRTRGFTKRSALSKLLGCSFEEFRAHIASQFREGMSWDNYGSWHIDHIIPLSTAKTLDALENLAHYTNLQPLWAAENLSKKDKLTPSPSN